MRAVLHVLGFALILATAILMSLLMASHLPFAADETKIARIVERDRTPTWRAFHITVEGCPCSARLLAYLRTRSLSGFRETSLVLGRDFDADWAHQRYGFEGVPWLVLVDPDGHLRYSGGYTASPASTAYQDQHIAARARSGVLVRPLPAYGCPTASGSRKKLKLLRMFD